MFVELQLHDRHTELVVGVFVVVVDKQKSLVSLILVAARALISVRYDLV